MYSLTWKGKPMDEKVRAGMMGQKKSVLVDAIGRMLDQLDEKTAAIGKLGRAKIELHKEIEGNERVFTDLNKKIARLTFTKVNWKR